MVALVVVETVVLALVVLLVAGLLRSHADILRALHDLGVGLEREHPSHGHDSVRVAPPSRRGSLRGAESIAGVTPDGDGVALSMTTGRGRTLLAFLSSGCLTCETLWADLRHRPASPADTRVVVVTQGDDRESPSRVQEQASGVGVPVVMASEAFDAYQVPGAPYFVLVGADGAIEGEGTASRWDQVLELVGRATADERLIRPVHDWANDPEREARNDRELLAAGIGPGDPRLFFTARQGPEGAPVAGGPADPLAAGTP